jgi:hypothetical protein
MPRSLRILITSITILIGYVVLVFLGLKACNLYFRHVLIQHHGRDLGLSLWRQWKL